jgi:hypothetical protein
MDKMADNVREVPIGSCEAKNQVEGDRGNPHRFVQVGEEDACAAMESQADKILPETAVNPYSRDSQKAEQRGKDSGQKRAYVSTEKRIMSFEKPPRNCLVCISGLAMNFPGGSINPNDLRWATVLSGDGNLIISAPGLRGQPTDGFVAT